MEQQNICRRNCNECTLQPTLETKQLCATFNAIQILAFVENKLNELSKAVDREIVLPEIPTSSISIVDFNGNVVTGSPIATPLDSADSVAPTATE